ncbi:MAG: (2Fe-2S) ferredoxin domain-containing protein [Spirochaetales bacterium]|nr:(2Fe-2S) ferredoxin domain-containing protein [Spirochaetales bacterium]
MEKPGRHIFLCGSFRANGEAQGICSRKGGPALVQYLQEELADRGMDDVFVSTTSCLKICDRGPAMVIYPDNTWYGGIESEEDIDEILDSLEKNEENEEYLLN